MPTLVGETASGDPIFEIRSVRLVLRGDATHFARLAACAKCGREVPGGAVLSPADLDLSPHPVICKECVSTAGSPLFERSERGVPPASTTPLRPAPVNGSAGERPTPAANDARLAALERGLADLVAQRPSTGSIGVAAAERARIEALERRLEDAVEQLRTRAETERAELHGALETRMDGLQAALDVAERSGREEVARLHRVSVEQARLWDEMGGRLDQVVERLAEASDSARARVQDVDERVHRAGDEQARVWDELGRRVDQVAERLTQDSEWSRARVQGIEDRVQHTAEEQARALDDVGGRITQVAQGLAQHGDSSRARMDDVEGRVQQRLQAAVEEGSGRAEAGAAALADAGAGLAQAEAAVDRLQQDLAAVRSELQAAIDAGFAATTVTVHELAERQAQLGRRVDVVAERLPGLVEGITAQRAELSATVEARAGQVEARVVQAEERAQGIEDRVQRAAEEQARALDDVGGRIAQVAQGLAQHRDSARARADDVDGRVQRLQAAVDEGSGRAEAEAAALAEAGAGLAGVEAAVDRLQQDLAAVRSELQETIDAGIAATTVTVHELAEGQAQLGRRVDLVAERLPGLVEGIAAQHAEFSATVEARAGEVEARVVQAEERTRGALSATEALDRAYEGLRHEVGHLARSDSAVIEGAHAELARLGDQLNERLDRLAERIARHGPPGAALVAATVQRQVEEAEGRLTETLAAQRGELEDRLAKVGASAGVDADRVQGLEESAAKTAAQLSEVEELLSVLDGGFGELRSGVEGLRQSQVERAAEPVDVRAIVPVASESGRRPLRRSEVPSHLAALTAATEELARKQQWLEAQLADLERASESTTHAVARAASKAAAVTPLRSDVAAAHAQLAAHDEALGRLSRSIDALRRKIPAAPPSPAKPAPRKRKGAAAT